MKNRILWILFGRKKISAKVPGFTAHWSSLAEDSTFQGFNAIGPRTKISDSIIGRNTYIAQDSNVTRVDIGKFCSIGPGCWLGGLDRHPTDRLSTHPSFYSNRAQSNRIFNIDTTIVETARTLISHDVWIGARSTILSGVSVGTGAVIGAGAVVVKNVPPYAIVAGNPARIIRQRFSDNLIQTIMEAKWWDLPDDVIAKWARELFSTNEIDTIVEKLKLLRGETND